MEIDAEPAVELRALQTGDLSTIEIHLWRVEFEDRRLVRADEARELRLQLAGAADLSRRTELSFWPTHWTVAQRQSRKALVKGTGEVQELLRHSDTFEGLISGIAAAW